MSARFAGMFRDLTREQRRLWGVAAGVVVVGTIFKTAYFKFSRGLVIESMDARHMRATAHLREAREFASWAEKDRESRAPKLTPDQRRQLQEYLILMAENNREVYPQEKETGFSGRGGDRQPPPGA